MHAPMIRPNLILVAALALLLSACGTVAAVQPGPFEPYKEVKVTLGKTWTAYPMASRTKLRNLTIDGLALNQLSFAGPIEDGESLIVTSRGDKEKLVPKFRSDMGEFELIEFVTDSLMAVGLENLKTSDIRAEPFGTLSGVRFEFGGAAASGLKYAGTAKLAVDDGKLHLVLYYAPAEYYFGLHKAEVEKILRSITLI